MEAEFVISPVNLSPEAALRRARVQSPTEPFEVTHVVPARHVALKNAFANASWIGPPTDQDLPAFWDFAVGFAWAGGEITLHVTADQRFKLFVNGVPVARGPECGTQSRWFYHTFRIVLPMGNHEFRAMVWSLGELSPYAHTTVQPAFLLAAEDSAGPFLTTGLAHWRVARLHEFKAATTRSLPGAHFIGPSFDIDPTLVSENFEAAAIVAPALPQLINGRLSSSWCLAPGELPQPELRPWTHWRARAAVDEWVAESAVIEQRWCDALLGMPVDLASGKAILIPAHSEWTMLLDAESIITVYAGVVTNGGRDAVVDLSWAESLAHEASVIDNIIVTKKGHRDHVAGKRFYGFGDTFHPSGGDCSFETPWWRAGRYLLVRVRTAEEPLRIMRLSCLTTGYEFESHARFEAGEPMLTSVLALCDRGLRASCHEVYADSPAHEQLMYAGDARVQMLVHRCLETDDRLARKAVQLFGESRHAGDGWTLSRIPSRVGQLIPAFSLIYVLMVEDFMRWRNDSAFVRSQLPAMRSVLDIVESHLDHDGMLAHLPGWLWIDWCPEWRNGVPPHDASGRCTAVNLFYVLALAAAARVETALGSKLRARHLSEINGHVSTAIRTFCFNAGIRLFMDAPGVPAYSEHTQALAVLALGRDIDEKRTWLAAAREARVSLAPSSYYFDHYVFEAHWEARDSGFFSRLQKWTDLLAKGCVTPIESLEPNRSDCHGWGAHPLFHAYATIAGIRPTSWGPSDVTIAPLQGPLRSLDVRVPWFGGTISFEVAFAENRAQGAIILPKGVHGEFVFGNLSRPLQSGLNII